jgi:hypothetical protein
MRRPLSICLALSLTALLAAPPGVLAARITIKPLKFVQPNQLLGVGWQTPVSIGSEAGGAIRTFIASVKLDPGVTVTGLSYWHAAGTGGGTLVKLLYGDETTTVGNEVEMLEAGSAVVTADNFTPIKVDGDERPGDKVIRKGRKYMVIVNCNPDSFVWEVVVTYQK